MNMSFKSAISPNESHDMLQAKHQTSVMEQSLHQARAELEKLRELQLEKELAEVKKSIQHAHLKLGRN
jgi:hypothetical protein